jgi:hypothetical protein
MTKYFLINGRLMQRQPSQLQQGGILGPTQSAPSANTLLGGDTEQPTAPPPPGLVPDATGRVPERDENVMAWIKHAAEQPYDPISYLQAARRRGRDKMDDNLPAAERYFDGLQGNYNGAMMLGELAVKDARDVQTGSRKPLAKLPFGKNGSKNAGFVTKWGLTGVFDRKYGISHQDRVQLGAPGPLTGQQ